MTATPADRSDAGFTLIEMLVACALFSLVILVAGGIMMGQFSAQGQVSAITSTTTDAQLAGNSIDAGIRNSSGFKLSATGADQFLVARVAGTGATLQWHCTAWYYSAAHGELRTATRAPGAPWAAPTAAQLADWVLLADGVRPSTGSTIFTAGGDTVAASFEVSTRDDDRPVAIEVTSTPLAGVTGNSTCY